MANPVTGRLVTEDEAAATHAILRVVTFAETVRLVPVGDEAGVDLDQFRAAVDTLAHHGIGQHLQRLWEGGDNSPKTLGRMASALLAAIAESPIPDAEWTPVSDLLGDDLLARVLGVSASSLTRYRSGERATPDPVANRLHTITQIVSDLAGSYNDFGIRRWFTRPRQALDGRAPADILVGDWTPDEPGVAQVRDLAATLLGAARG